MLNVRHETLNGSQCLSNQVLKHETYQNKGRGRVCHHHVLAKVIVPVDIRVLQAPPPRRPGLVRIPVGHSWISRLVKAPTIQEVPHNVCMTGEHCALLVAEQRGVIIVNVADTCQIYAKTDDQWCGTDIARCFLDRHVSRFEIHPADQNAPPCWHDRMP